MSEVEICGLTRLGRPKPNKEGHTILAFFDCLTRGLLPEGCALVRTANKALVAWPPKLDQVTGSTRKVSIRDDSLRHAMMLHAHEVYRALGGTDAEEIGYSTNGAAC
jgi:hypothetical protein